jgi:hypothetical protein
MVLYPLSHKNPKTNAQIKAKTNFTNTPKIETLLNKAIIQAITAIAKYTLAGVQSLLKSLFILYTN